MANQYQPHETYNMNPKVFDVIKALGKENSESLSDVCELMHEASSLVKKQQLEISSLRGSVEGLKLNRMKKLEQIQNLKREYGLLAQAKGKDAFDDDPMLK